VIVDIFLYGPAVPSTDIILCDPTVLCGIGLEARPGDDKPGRDRGRGRHLLPRGKPILERRREPAIVAVSLMDNLVEEYGVVHGREVYFAMQREMKGPFAPGNKYDVTARPHVEIEPEHPIDRVPVARRT
jgi:hypothetical protein